VLVSPPIVGWLTYRLCKELAARDGVPTGSRVAVRDIPGRLRRGTGPGPSAPATAPEAAAPDAAPGR